MLNISLPKLLHQKMNNLSYWLQIWQHQFSHAKEPTSKIWKPGHCPFKTILIIYQEKAFCRRRIPQSSCASKETADIDIIITPTYGDRKIMQSIRIASVSPTESEHLPKQYLQKRLRVATFWQWGTMSNEWLAALHSCSCSLYQYSSSN